VVSNDCVHKTQQWIGAHPDDRKVKINPQQKPRAMPLHSGPLGYELDDRTKAFPLRNVTELHAWIGHIDTGPNP